MTSVLPPRSLSKIRRGGPPWRSVHNQIAVLLPTSPPRGLSTWSGVSREHRPTEARLRGGVRRAFGHVLVMNIARRGQASPWREMVHIILNLVPFGAGPAGHRVVARGFPGLPAGTDAGPQPARSSPGRPRTAEKSALTPSGQWITTWAWMWSNSDKMSPRERFNLIDWSS